MARTCTICNHSKRAEIDQALLDGRPHRGIARHHRVSDDAVQRHRRHIPKAMTAAKGAEDAAHADDLLAKAQGLETDARRLLRRAEKTGDIRAALGGVRELSRLLELLGRLRGELDAHGAVVVNVNNGTREESASLSDQLHMAASFTDALLRRILSVFPSLDDADARGARDGLQHLVEACREMVDHVEGSWPQPCYGIGVDSDGSRELAEALAERDRHRDAFMRWLSGTEVPTAVSATATTATSTVTWNNGSVGRA